jgi:transcription initiation factor TFIIIB Brf1 subunit/transcription initiation factor TFIIB
MSTILDTIDTTNLSDEQIQVLLDKERFRSQIQSSKIRRCVGCLSNNVVDDMQKGHRKCRDCGVCDINIYDDGPERNNFEDGGDSKVRCSGATSFFFPKASLGTIMGGNKYSLLRRVQGWGSMPYKEISLSKILKLIDNYCRKMNLPKAVSDNAKYLYNDIHKVKHLFGDNVGKNVIIRGFKKRIGLYGGCIYYGAQYQGFCRRIEEIANILKVEEYMIIDGIKKIKELLPNNIILNSVSAMSSDDFTERYTYKMNFSREQVKEIVKMSKNVTRLTIADNHQPISITAALIKVYCEIYDMKINIKTIAKTFNITTVTIEKIYCKIIPFKKVIVCDEKTSFVREKFIKTKYIVLNEDGS